MIKFASRAELALSRLDLLLPHVARQSLRRWWWLLLLLLLLLLLRLAKISAKALGAREAIWACPVLETLVAAVPFLCTERAGIARFAYATVWSGPTFLALAGSLKALSFRAVASRPVTQRDRARCHERGHAKQRR